MCVHVWWWWSVRFITLEVTVSESIICWGILIPTMVWKRYWQSGRYLAVLASLKVLLLYISGLELALVILRVQIKPSVQDSSWSLFCRGCPGPGSGVTSLVLSVCWNRILTGKEHPGLQQNSGILEWSTWKGSRASEWVLWVGWELWLTVSIALVQLCQGWSMDWEVPTTAVLGLLGETAVLP